MAHHIAAVETGEGDAPDVLKDLRGLHQPADLAARQAEQTRTREAQFAEELTRRVRDYEEAQRFAAKLAEQERQRQEAMQQSHSPGPEPPTRAR